MQLYYFWQHEPSQKVMNAIKEKNLQCDFLEVNQLDSYPEFLKGVPTVVEDDYMYTGSHAIQYIDEKESQAPTQEPKEKVDMSDCKSFLAERNAEIKQDAVPTA